PYWPSSLYTLLTRPLHYTSLTLFPYTTLFRAACVVVDLRGNGGGDMGPMLAGLSPLLPDGDALFFHSAMGDSPETVDGTSTSGGDRKSTRLNSSHVSISYAVFRWKKNRNTRRP